jgi:hypothetical protein
MEQGFDPWVIAGIVAFVLAVFAALWLLDRGKIKNFICPNPNCGFRGRIKPKYKGSGCLCIILFCLGFLPGLIYMLVAFKTEYKCPNCEIQLGS